MLSVVCLSALFLSSAGAATGAAFAEGMSVTASSDAVSWTAVENATSYTVDIADSSGQNVFFLSFPAGTTYLPLAEVLTVGGVYTVTVTALSDSAAIASASEHVTCFRTLPSVSGITFADGVMSWDAVPGATGYSLSVNGIGLGNFSSPSADVGDLMILGGGYAAEVTALGDEFNFDSPSASFSFTLSAPPLPVCDMVISSRDGSIFASWLPSDESTETYVYRVFYNDKLLKEETVSSPFAYLDECVTADGEYVVSVSAVSDGKESAPLTKTFVVSEGGLQQ